MSWLDMASSRAGRAELHLAATVCVHGAHGPPGPAGCPPNMCAALVAVYMLPPASPYQVTRRHTHLLYYALALPLWRAAPKQARARRQAACAVWRAGGILSPCRQACWQQSRRVVLAFLVSNARPLMEQMC